MKIKPMFLYSLLFFASCHPGDKKPVTEQKTVVDTTKMLYDSAMPGTQAERPPSALKLNTHLRDTAYYSGNFILFLLPDNERFKELENEDGAGDADSDFAVGIANTTDSLPKNYRYSQVKAFTTEKRYIYIKDCKNGPRVIDRDSASYGYILSGKGKQAARHYEGIHSGDYLGEIDDYFFGH